MINKTFYEVKQRTGREWTAIALFTERTASALFINAYKAIDPSAEFSVRETAENTISGPETMADQEESARRFIERFSGQAVAI